VRTAFLRERSQRWLEESGYWSPQVLVSEFSGGTAAVAHLAGGAPVQSVWRPVRPPVLGRDLARVSDPALRVLVAQHRLAARESLTEMLSFSSENEKKVALASLGRIHRELTGATLERIGRTSGGAAMERLVRALRGPRGRLDLLAPAAEGAELKLAVALYRLGAPRKALEFLRDEEREQQEERFGVLYWRGRCLQELEQKGDALAAYQKALGVKPGDVEVLLRVARIHLENRHLSRAQRRLEEVLEKNPDSVEALVNLSYIHGKRHRFERATELARRALEIDPDNSAARDQYVLYRWRARLGGEGER
jgi:tetratricopeptide (TPR) repeat protein